MMAKFSSEFTTFVPSEHLLLECAQLEGEEQFLVAY